VPTTRLSVGLVIGVSVTVIYATVTSAVASLYPLFANTSV
jgi:hypothetical protein